MERGSLNLSEVELIASTMSTLNAKEDRRVIDIKDIREFKRALINQGRLKNFAVKITDTTEEEQKKFDLYIKKIEDKYLMLPYTTSYDLFSEILVNINGRILALIRNEEFIYKLSNRGNDEINNMESLLDSSFQKVKTK